MTKFCKHCFDTQDTDILPKGYIADYYLRSENDTICPICGGSLSISILTDEEYDNLILVSHDSTFFKAMEDLKRTDPIEFQLKMSQFKNQVDAKFESNVPKCPTCGSTNIEKIRATKRWITVGLFGLGSSDAGKSMRCRDCGYKW